jgi:hypothetical protein
MAYGIEVTTSDGYQVLDENNHIMIVAEKGTIEGTRSTPFGSGDNINNDTGDKWIRIREDIDPTSGINYVTTNYYATVALAASYTEKPLVAIRGKNGAAIILPNAYPYKHSSSSYNRIRFSRDISVSTDWILITPSSATTPTVSSGNFGMQVINSSSQVLFDSRWEELMALKEVATFDTFSTSHNYRTSGAPSGGSVTIPTGQQGDFYCLTSAQGIHEVKSWKEDIGEGLFMFHYGGIFLPSLNTEIDGGSVSTTMVRKQWDFSNFSLTESATGGVTSSSATGGKWMAMRYTNF